MSYAVECFLGADYVLNGDTNLWSKINKKKFPWKDVLKQKKQLTPIADLLEQYKQAVGRQAELKKQQVMLFNRFKRAIMRFEVEDFAVSVDRDEMLDALSKNKLFLTRYEDDIVRETRELKKAIESQLAFESQPILSRVKCEQYLDRIIEMENDKIAETSETGLKRLYNNIMDNFDFYNNWLREQRQKWNVEIDKAQSYGMTAAQQQELDEWDMNINEYVHYMTQAQTECDSAFVERDAERLAQIGRETGQYLGDNECPNYNANDYVPVDEIGKRQGIIKYAKSLKGQDTEEQADYIKRFKVDESELCVKRDNDNVVESLRELSAVQDPMTLAQRVQNLEINDKLSDKARGLKALVKCRDDKERDIDEIKRELSKLDDELLSQDDVKRVQIMQDELRDITFSKALKSQPMYDKLMNLLETNGSLLCKMNIEPFEVDDDFMNVRKNVAQIKEQLMIPLTQIINILNAHQPSYSKVMNTHIKVLAIEFRKFKRSIRDDYSITSVTNRLASVMDAHQIVCHYARERYNFLGGIPDNTKSNGHTHGHMAGEYKTY